MFAICNPAIVSSSIIALKNPFWNNLLMGIFCIHKYLQTNPVGLRKGALLKTSRHVILQVYRLKAFSARFVLLSFSCEHGKKMKSSLRVVLISYFRSVFFFFLFVFLFFCFFVNQNANYWFKNTNFWRRPFVSTVRKRRLLKTEVKPLAYQTLGWQLDTFSLLLWSFLLFKGKSVYCS